VAQGVVDGLEAIEVQHQHPDRLAAAGDASEGLGQPVLEQCPIRQAGQGVSERLVGELLFEAATLRHVPPVPDDAPDLGVGGQVGGRQLQKAPRPVGMQESNVHGFAFAQASDALERLRDRRPVFDRDQVQSLPAEPGGGLDAEHMGQRRTDVGDDTLAVGQDDEIGALLHQGLEAGVARRLRLQLNGVPSPPNLPPEDHGDQNGNGRERDEEGQPPRGRRGGG
jgi:hypothetical protein